MVVFMNLEKNMFFLAPLVKGFREYLLADNDRPGYHFCVPEGIAKPGDPNGCFYANGRYHMMYLYKAETGRYCWAHVSSIDLLHWRYHPDSIVGGIHGRSCYSGGAFLDDDGKCYISYWDFLEEKHDFGGIRIAVSDGEPYEKWEPFPDYAVKCVNGGGKSFLDPLDESTVIGAADPSNIWKKDGKYYMQTGNFPAIKPQLQKENPPENLIGDWVDLFSSDDMHTWNYEGRFYDRNMCLSTENREDDMCPSFLPLPKKRDGGEESGKYLQLFISHCRGCQYYVGDYDKKNDRFIPQSHGRMSVVDNTYFAPEALIDGNGRQIMWAWLIDNPDDASAPGWSGVFGMARELWYDESDNTLRMAPAVEYETLRINPQTFYSDVCKDDQLYLDLKNKLSFELCISDISPENRDKVTLRLRESDDGSEYTLVYFDSEKGELVFDSTKGSPRGFAVIERMPVTLDKNEMLNLRVFVDKSVIEVYANDRAAICRRVYPSQDGLQTSIAQSDKNLKLKISAWEIAPCNPF